MADVQEILEAARDENLPRMRELLAIHPELLEAEYIRETPLIIAIRNGNLEMVEYLLSLGADPNHEAGYGTVPLQGAKTTAIASRLLDAGARIDDRGSYHKNTPLELAVKWGDLQMATLLVDRGAKINYEEEGHPVTVLSVAGERCSNPAVHMEIVKFLLERGADVSLGGESAVLTAIGKNNMPLFDFLMEKGIGATLDPSKMFEIAISKDEMLHRLSKQYNIKLYGAPLLEKAAGSRKADLVNRLLDMGVVPSDMNLNKYILLGVPTVSRLIAMGLKPTDESYFDLIRAGDVDVFQMIVEKGIEGFDPSNLLVFARVFGKKKVFLDILLKYVDVTKYGGKLLAKAIEIEDPELVDQLLAMNVNVNILDGESPLSLILKRLRYETNASKTARGIDLAKQLVERGATVQTEDLLILIAFNLLDLFPRFLEKVAGDIDYKTLLLEAMKVSKNKDILEFLLGKVDLVKYGRSILCVAIDTNNAELVDRMLSMKVDINDPLGIETPLIHAARKNNIALVKRLIEMGADPRAKTSQGLIACMASTHPEIREFLSPRWHGFTKSDVSKLRVVFDTEVPANGGIVPAINYSMCPICLAFIERKDACAIMSHECEKDIDRPDAIVFDIALHDKYMNDNNKIYWCTICNRICERHNHLQVAPVEGAKPEKAVVVVDSDDYFTDDCRMNIGGGGVPEKVVRFHAFLSEAARLQPLVGSISEVEAKQRLVKALWNAPLQAGAKNAANAMITKKQFNGNNSAFAANISPASASASSSSSASASSSAEANEVIAIPNYNNTLVPVVSDIDDENDVVELHHRRTNGTVSDHTNDKYEVVDIDGLMNLVNIMNRDRGDKTVFAKCPFKPCDAWIYPQEIESALSQAKHVGDKSAYQAILDTYKGHFNKRFGKGNAGGRRTRRTRINIRKTIKSKRRISTTKQRRQTYRK